MRLRPIQAQALYELGTLGRLMAPIPVGGGKELVSLLAAVALGKECVVILVPHGLKAQLLKKDIPTYGAHFRLPKTIHVVSYSTLSSKSGRNVLETLSPKPEVVVANEAHTLGGRSARARRWRRWRKANAHIPFVPLSGTFVTRSIKEAAPLASDALGDFSPYPRDWSTLDAWSWSLDDGVLFEGEPGVLEQWCAKGETVKEAWRRRVFETPGLVGGSVGPDGCAASLYFHYLSPKVPQEVAQALGELGSLWRLPDGTDLESPLAKYQAEQTLASGYFLRRTWPRGEPEDLRREWTQALKDWNAEVREALKRPRAGLDSPELLWDAAERGEWRAKTYERWAKVKGLCRPGHEAVWVSDFLVRAVGSWTSKHRGIVWVDGPDLGRRLERDLDIPYFGEGAKASEAILEADGSTAIVASINAHSEGKNLQVPFGGCLFTCVPATSKVWEQSVGRVHRPGQPRAEVSVYVFQHTEHLRNTMSGALRNAKHIQETQGFSPKLLLGTHLAI
jgi:hypothetical protein